MPGEPGKALLVSCPTGCSSGASVWGTDVYTDDSAVCPALIHAGAISVRADVGTLANGEGDQSAATRLVEGCDKTGPAWGTDVYTADSAVCTSAIHAGVIPATGGTFTLELVEGKPEYPGTNRNGVTSLKYANYGLSFVVRKAQ